MQSFAWPWFLRLVCRSVFHGQDRVSTFFFSVSVPAGDEHLPDLLRQLADHLEGLGDVSVRDVTVNPAQQVGGYSVATVYYNRLSS
jgi:hypothetical protein